jgi:hypothetical protein
LPSFHLPFQGSSRSPLTDLDFALYLGITPVSLFMPPGSVSANFQSLYQGTAAINTYWTIDLEVGSNLLCPYTIVLAFFFACTKIDSENSRHVASRESGHPEASRSWPETITSCSGNRR